MLAVALAGMPEALADVGGDVRGEQEPKALGFLSVCDPEGLAAELPPVEPGGALEAFQPVRLHRPHHPAHPGQKLPARPLHRLMVASCNNWSRDLSLKVSKSHGGGESDTATSPS